MNGYCIRINTYTYCLHDCFASVQICIWKEWKSILYQNLILYVWFYNWIFFLHILFTNWMFCFVHVYVGWTSNEHLKIMITHYFVWSEIWIHIIYKKFTCHTSIMKSTDIVPLIWMLVKTYNQLWLLSLLIH